ncbi:MAG: metallophosphoesterase family protein [archaeon]|nr:metallophosphatase family protein [Candidatus Micrarchaeota archaeon]
MKLCIFSDIHGNAYAFEKIIASMKKEKPDRYIFCGDICGYYYNQNKIIDSLYHLKNFIGVLGNHDKLFLDMFNGLGSEKDYVMKYGNSNRLLFDKITDKNLGFLQELKEQEILNIENNKIAIFHGSPWNALNDYVYPDSPLERFAEYEYDFIFLGNTHYPMDRQINGLRIINPGSCGQPRDSYLPSYAVLDLESRKTKIIRVNYNCEALISEIQGNNEKNRYLIDILLRGKPGRI